MANNKHLPWNLGGMVQPDTALRPDQVQHLQLLAEGLENADIGKRMHWHSQTISNKTGRLLDQLHAVNRVNLIYLALKEGIIT